MKKAKLLIENENNFLLVEEDIKVNDKFKIIGCKSGLKATFIAKVDIVK